MKKRTIIIAVVAITVIAGIGLTVVRHFSIHRDGTAVSVIGGTDGPTSVFVAGKLSGGDEEVGYTSITMGEAQKIFETEGDYLILDVRRADEYVTGHIPGAINIANEEIGSADPEGLPDKDQTIYVYCRSGNRSKQASEKLAVLGYTNIIEIGGIADWQGDIES